MAQVTGHEVLSNGDHVLELDNGKKLTVSGDKVAKDASWGQVLEAANHSATTGVPDKAGK